MWLKNVWHNFVSFFAPVAMGVGLVFIIVSSRIGLGNLSFALGLAVSIALFVIGVLLAPRKNTMLPWSRAFVAFGFTFILYSICISNWENVGEGLVALVLGFLLTPSRK